MYRNAQTLRNGKKLRRGVNSLWGMDSLTNANIVPDLAAPSLVTTNTQYERNIAYVILRTRESYRMEAIMSSDEVKGLQTP